MKIAVAIFTYNQAAYLGQALDSVLDQNTTHTYEVFVVDDGSTDGTADVLASYAHRYPDLIRPTYRPKNLGAIPSALELFDRIPGEYVALLEGDDYWVDPSKLDLQVDFLEANRDFVLCGHDCVVRNEWTGEETVKGPLPHDYTLTTEHLIDFHVPTASMVFRNGLIRSWPARLLKAGFCDRPLALMLSGFGQVRYFARPMSVHRLHPGGMWSGRYIVDPSGAVLETTTDGLLKLIEFWESLREYCDHRFDDRIDALVRWARLEMDRQLNGDTRTPPR